MPLTPMDEYLAHQIPEPFDTVYTTDRNFYDRYYFNLHRSSDELFVVTGIGQYPNLGVTDAFVTVAIEGEQHTVRASAELDGNRHIGRAGPFTFEVIEGLRSLRLVLEPNEWGVAFDLRFDGTVAALAEPKSLTFRGPRKVQDTFRYAQVGSYTGSLEVAGTTHEVTPDRWAGARDHSWGVRGIGEPEPPGIAVKDHASGPTGFYHNWLPMQFDDHMVKITIDETATGERVNEEGELIWGIDSGRPNEHVGRPHLEVEYLSGTREVAAAVVTFTDETGAATGPTVQVTPLRTVYLKEGSGYSYDGYWGHGVYQGELKVEGLVTEIPEPTERRHLSWLNETLCRFEKDDGTVGYGMYENMVAGMYLPAGFDTHDKMAD